jgi:hypothetical protein
MRNRTLSAAWLAESRFEAGSSVGSVEDLVPYPCAIFITDETSHCVMIPGARPVQEQYPDTSDNAVQDGRVQD